MRAHQREYHEDGHDAPTGYARHEQHEGGNEGKRRYGIHGQQRRERRRLDDYREPPREGRRLVARRVVDHATDGSGRLDQ